MSLWFGIAEEVGLGKCGLMLVRNRDHSGFIPARHLVKVSVQGHLPARLSTSRPWWKEWSVAGWA